MVGGTSRAVVSSFPAGPEPKGMKDGGSSGKLGRVSGDPQGKAGRKAKSGRKKGKNGRRGNSSLALARTGGGEGKGKGKGKGKGRKQPLPSHAAAFIAGMATEAPARTVSATAVFVLVVRVGCTVAPAGTVVPPSFLPRSAFLHFCLSAEMHFCFLLSTFCLLYLTGLRHFGAVHLSLFAIPAGSSRTTPRAHCKPACPCSCATVGRRSRKRPLRQGAAPAGRGARGTKRRRRRRRSAELCRRVSLRCRCAPAHASVHASVQACVHFRGDGGAPSPAHRARATGKHFNNARALSLFNNNFI